MADEIDWDGELTSYRRTVAGRNESEPEKHAASPPKTPHPPAKTISSPGPKAPAGPPPHREVPIPTSKQPQPPGNPAKSPAQVPMSPKPPSTPAPKKIEHHDSDEEKESPALRPVTSPRTDDDDDDEKSLSLTGKKDDDDDEPDPAKAWAEYKDGKGGKLWYNTVTREVSMIDPKELALKRMESNAGEEDGEELEEKGEGRVTRLVGDDEEGPTKLVTGKKGKKGAKKEKMTVGKIITTMTLIEKQLDQVLEFSQLMNESVVGEMREIRKRVGAVQQTLEHSAEDALDSRDDVSALIEMDKLPWNFKNFHVDHYRAAAGKINHAELEFKDWHAPQYLSDFPLPPESKSITAVVRLPTSDTASGKTAQPDGSVMTHTRINITETDTVNKAIVACVSKCKGLQGDASDYVLKASGYNDFFYGDKFLFSYEYVRKCLRDGIELKLVLVKRPTPLPAAEAKDLAAEYRNKVDQKIEVITPETYRGLSTRGAWDEIKAIPISELRDMPFKVRIIGIDHLTPESVPKLDSSVTSVYVRVFLFHGTQKIAESEKMTKAIPVVESPRWMQWLMADFNKETVLNALPRAVRLAFLLTGKKEAEKDKEIVLGWAVKQLIDQQGKLCMGEEDIRLWGVADKTGKKHGKKRDFDPNFIFRATNRDNWSIPQPAVLRVKFDEYAIPVVAPLTEKYREPNPRAVGPEINPKTLHKTQVKKLEELIESDPLYVLTDDDKKVLWDMRHGLVKFPSVLPKFLLSVKWGQPEHKFEALRLLNLWAPPHSLAHVMELLDVKYPDYTVREYAVNLLRRMKDDELRLYMLQLVQCLKFEPYHDSPLSRFLIERSLKNPLDIGHNLYWHLKAELHNAPHAERFALILEEYLSHCGRFSHELRKQSQAVRKLQRVAELVVKLKREHGYGDEEVIKEYRRELEKLNTDFFVPMGRFQIPLNPKLEASTLIIEKCRYMSSKMVPLWLVFKNVDDDAPPIYIIFKSGDDLRQDILTLQILTVMDRLWLSAGLDMRMKPYRVIATGVNDQGEGVGMIEVVTNSDTTSGIQLQYGGGAMGALKLDPIDLYLHDHNKGKPLYEKAVQNFICSCAGYCVATFVLGVGDRHNGNIMVTKDGHLFHIDFGHFLGNFKKKFGVNRERAAFVFTPEMAYVMGGKKYQKSPLFKKFLLLCTESFKTLRQNALMLEALFTLMVSAQMPELTVEEDINYMRDKLFLSVNEKKADKKLHAEINKSLDSTYRRIDNMIHNLKHG